MRQESRELRRWYIDERKKLAEKFGGEVSNPEYKREMHNLANRFHREKKKQLPQKDQETPVKVTRIPYSEEALAAISDPLEQAVIKVHLSDVTKSPSKIAEEIGEGLSAQMVTAILGREDVKQVVKGLVWADISLASEIAVRDGVAKKDPVWVKIAHEYGYISKKEDQCGGFHASPIVDPEAEEVLKAVGDWICFKGYNLLLKGKGTETRTVEL